MSSNTAERPMLTFVIPVRHQDNASDWSGLVDRLRQTARSIAAQTHPSWRAVVVANEGAELPELPAGFEVARVEFPPNRMHEIDATNREAAYDAFRLDKGRRVLAGMLHARDTGYFMIVDDDDFVSAGITRHAADHAGANGWFVGEGFVWAEGGHFVFRHKDFANFCGTSLIIRADLYRLPASFAEADETFIKRSLGSHIFIKDELAAAGTPLAPLPFPGAIYRIGHAGAHSKSRGLLRTFLVRRDLIKTPKTLAGNALRFRPLTRQLRAAFGMAA
jgi:hypothetical protein